MSDKPKKLSKSALSKYASELNQKKIVYILDGKHSCTISKIFLETDVEALVLEYVQLVNELNQIKDITPETMLCVPRLLYGLICKHFTDLPIEMTNIHEIVGTTKDLLNTGIVGQLFSGDPDHGFEQSEIEKVSKAINKVSKNIGQAIGEMVIKDTLSNSEFVEEEVEDGE